MKKSVVFGGIGFLLVISIAVAATVVPDIHWMGYAVTNELEVAEFLKWSTGAATQYYPSDGFAWDGNILGLDTSRCNYYAGYGYITYYFDPNLISSGTLYETYIALYPKSTGTTDVTNNYVWFDSTNRGHSVTLDYITVTVY
jgi:hypothetical protein